MALVLADRVKETCTSPGVGSVTLLGASTGFQAFSVLGNGNTTYYTISDQSGPRWEVGIGTYNSSGNSLTRGTVLASSNSNALVDFNSGSQDVYVVYPAGKAIYTDATSNVNALGSITSGTWNGSTIGVLYGGTGQTSYTNGELLIGNTTGNTLTKATLTQGTGIAITNAAGSITVANSAPDQVVSLANGTGISVSGTYPSFTVANSLPMTYPAAGIAVSTGTAWNTSLTAPSGAVVGTTDNQTLTTKTIALGSNTISGTKAQFDTACTDGNFLYTDAIGSSVFAYDSNLQSFVTTFTLPTTDSTAGYVLSTNGAGTLSFVAQTGGGSMVYPGAGIAVSTGSAWGTSLSAPAGNIVGTTDSQTLTNKTITNLIFDGNYTEEVFTITDGASVSLNPANGTIQLWTLGASRTPSAASFGAGQSMILMVDDGSAFTITWTTIGVVWETDGGSAPTLSTTGYTAIVLWKVASTVYGARVGTA